MKKNKQERKFQTQWATNRKWLVYSDEENKMYCTLCKNGNVDSVFTKGTNNIKLECQAACQASNAHKIRVDREWREFPVVITGKYRPGKYSKF